MPVPTEVQTEVLIKSRRRCCVCFGLSNDLSEKQGQIAHLDHNPSNDDPDNLAWLCFVHHDRYDSRTSQGKGLTIFEVKAYRKSLWEAIEKNLHHHETVFPAQNPKRIELLKCKGQLVSVHRYQAVEGSMQKGWVPHNDRDYRLTDCDEHCIYYFDIASGMNLVASIEDVKISRDVAKLGRLLLILKESARS